VIKERSKRMKNKNEVCGKCNWHRHDRNSGEWICANPDSDSFGEETDYDDQCVDFEKRD
jgi:hypothetical protein